MIRAVRPSHSTDEHGSIRGSTPARTSARGRGIVASLTATLLLVSGACDAPVPAQQSAAASVTAAGACTISRIVDGDTFTCDDGVRVRLLLIDAPELSQRPFGGRAKRRLEVLAGVGTVVSLEPDVRQRDRYGRLLAYVWLADGRMLNEELLRSGMAVMSVHPPNVRHVERLRAAVDSAKATRAGLWSTSAFECMPTDRRARRC